MEHDELIALISGNIPKNKKKRILLEIKEDPDLYREYLSLKNAWALSGSQADLDRSTILTALIKQKKKQKQQNRFLIRRSLQTYFKYAAILFIVFIGGILLEKQLSNNSPDKNDIPAQFVVPAGQMAELTLPDGTHVWLNSDSRFSFSDGFNHNKRNVHLDGEAYFEVTKNKKPFIVHTQNGMITVLGTGFNVDAYPNSRFQATLVHGSIKYSNTTSQKDVILTPGEQLSCSEEGHISISRVKTEFYTSWRKGVINFHNEPLPEVIQKLERHFDVQISIADSTLNSIAFTGKIKDESLSDVLNLIKITTPIKYNYNKKNKRVTINLK